MSTEISVMLASLLTGKTTKTIYRWVDDGILTPRQSGADSKGSFLLALPDLAAHLSLPVSAELEAALQDAMEGKAAGFHNVALIFLEAGQPDIAIRWLEMAAKKGYADAMEWLATGYLEGLGTEVNLAHGIEWLGKAAVAGHPVALAKLRALDS